jgi:hypothetical protein
MTVQAEQGEALKWRVQFVDMLEYDRIHPDYKKGYVLLDV